MGNPDSCDPVMLELFRAEADAHLPVLSQGLLAMEKGRADERDLEAMMRAAHSIKGASRIVGIEAAVRVAHVMEDCFSAAQGHRITLSSDAVDVLLGGVDALQRICSPQTDEGMAEESIQALLDRITAIRDGQATTPARPPAQSAPASSASAERATLAAAVQEYRVALPAVLDATAAESLRLELADMLCRRPARIRLDFSQVQRFSAIGLSLLVSFAHEAVRGESPPKVEAVGASVAVANLLRTTGLNKAFGRAIET